MRRMSRTARILQIELPVLAILAFALLPFAWMILTSIKPTPELAEWPVRYLPREATLDHYRQLLERTSFAGNLLDSLIVATGAALLGLGVSIPAAYAFSRFRFRGRRALMTGFLTVNMFPIVLLIIPLFLVMRGLGLLDTYLGVVLGHSTFAIPFAIWMLTSYFSTVPVELDEAATIDGATRLEAIRHVILPLVMPGVVTAGIYIFITSWNEYLYASVLAGQDVRVLTVAIQTLIGEYEIAWGLLTGGGVVGALPVTVLFMFIQRRLIAGMTQGAVKG